MTSSRREFLRRSMAAAATLGAAGVLVACGDDDSNEDSSSSGDATTTTGGATAPTRHSLTVMMPFALGVNFIADIVAKSAGFMDDAGVDLDLQFAAGAPQALQQLAAGNVTVVRNSPLETLQAVVNQDAPFITVGMPNQRTFYTLTSLPDRPLALADLADTTVGIPTLGGNAEVTLDILLREAGVDPASVGRQAVGLDATSYGVLQEGIVDAILVPRSTVGGIRAQGEEPHVDLLEDVNPMLGTGLVTTTDYAEERRDAIVAYLRGLHAAMLAINDEEQLPDLLAAVQADDWDLPELADLEVAKRLVASVASRWFEDGEENLLRNIPERWEDGVGELVEQGVLPEGTEATDHYTNDLLDEALA